MTARRVAVAVGVVLLIGWEVVGFAYWADVYGVIPALLIASTMIGNFAIPFQTGAWGYLVWGAAAYTLLGFGAGGDDRSPS